MNQDIYIVEPSKLRLLQVTEKHLTERYISWLNNKEIVKYSELRHTTHTYDSCFQYWKSFQGKPHLFWAIELYHDDKWVHIGNINSFIDEKNKIADIGILIGENISWGNGYGTTIWKFVCNYLFSHRHIRKITAGTMSTNIRMLKIMRKAGMVEDGKRLKHYICDGREVDICHFALFKNDESMV